MIGLWVVGRRRADAELISPQDTSSKRAATVVSAQPRPTDDYDEPVSEMSAFLRSGRGLFWALPRPVLYLFQGGFDLARGRISARVVSICAFDALVRRALFAPVPVGMLLVCPLKRGPP